MKDKRKQGSHAVKEGHLSFCTRTLGWGMIPGFGSDLGCSTFQNPRTRGNSSFSPGLIPCHVGFVPLRLFELRSADCDYTNVAVWFCYFRFEQQHGARPAKSNAACSVLSRRVFGGYGVHTSTSPTVEIALGNGPDDAL